MPYNCIYHTPAVFNNIVMTSDGEVLTSLRFANDGKVEYSSQELPIFDDVRRWLDVYFSGQKLDFTPHFRIDNATPFRREVLDIVQQIPFGKTMTYGEIASQIAQNHRIAKMSAQAVGGAVGWNPICIIVPCHRVMGANNSLTGYGGGIRNKIELLKVEGHTLLY